MMWVYAVSDTNKSGGGGRKYGTKAGGRKSGSSRKKPMTQKEREDALADFYGIDL
jgi:hypothetical protein